MKSMTMQVLAKFLNVMMRISFCSTLLNWHSFKMDLLINFFYFYEYSFQSELVQITAIHSPPMKRFQKNCCGLRCWPLGIWVEWGSGFRASRPPLFRKSSFVVGYACPRWRLFGDTCTAHVFIDNTWEAWPFSLASPSWKIKRMLHFVSFFVHVNASKAVRLSCTLDSL